MAAIELNKDFLRALDVIEAGRSVFVTGKAGTGKSTLLSHFRSNTLKRIVVLAPTGVAALNVGGQTIHSFFRFKPGTTVEQIKKVKGKRSAIYRNLDAIVIDEISMVRVDLFDMIDVFLRLNGPDHACPFGGVQMIFFGDLYQLPPVVTSAEKEIFSSRYSSPYFFDADVMRRGFVFEYVELEKIYRQKDDAFVRVLNRIRNNSADDGDLAVLNARVGASLAGRSKFKVQLTTTNAMAAAINQEYLRELGGREFSFDANVDGDFDRQHFPTDETVRLKAGAQVMMLNNDQEGRWVNGTLGKVIGVAAGAQGEYAAVQVEFEDGSQEEVLPHTWEVSRYKFREEDKSLVSEPVGSFLQYPLKLAWAVTIHKSQGKTFEQVVIDIGNGTFAHGQAYVALSRATHLRGISLARPLQKRHILLDRRVVDFMTRYQYGLAHRDMPIERKIAMIRDAIKKEQSLEIIYLKTNDEKSRRVIRPLALGTMRYQDVEFAGVRAYCSSRGEERTFRIDRILEMAESATTTS